MILQLQNGLFFPIFLCILLCIPKRRPVKWKAKSSLNTWNLA